MLEAFGLCTPDFCIGTSISECLYMENKYLFSFGSAITFSI